MKFKPTKFLAGIVLALILAACGMGCGISGDHPLFPGIDQQESRCRQMLGGLEKAVQKADVEDVQDARVQGCPYLRVNRFLSSFTGELVEPQKQTEWIKRAIRLGNRGREAEIYNLPEPYLRKLFPKTTRTDAVKQTNRCAGYLGTVMSNDAILTDYIIAHALVPDDYRMSARILGLYPVWRWFVLHGLKKLQEEAIQNFQKSEVLTDSHGNWYDPAKPRPDFPRSKRAAVLKAAREKSALGIPEPMDMALFFDYFEPVFHVLPRPESDQIGRPYWKTEDEIAIDPKDPVVYRFYSFTRIKKDILLQLNYLVWFAKRPSEGVFDIYSGHLDGLIWRVTLDMDGRALLYDSVHPCGCYHKYYPVSDRLTPLKNAPTAEPPLILDKDIPDGETGRVVIHLSGGEHYVIGLSEKVYDIPSAVHIRSDSYDSLRSLPFREGFKSMFDENGLVRGTERKERFFVWPMGVPSAGAMRQQGHHALALVGRLYFDEPRLFEKVFRFE